MSIVIDRPVHALNSHTPSLSSHSSCHVMYHYYQQHLSVFELWLQINFQRQGSYDTVRKIVQEEGRSARNLIQWNVPVDQDDQSTQREPLDSVKYIVFNVVKSNTYSTSRGGQMSRASCSGRSGNPKFTARIRTSYFQTLIKSNQ